MRELLALLVFILGMRPVVGADKAAAHQEPEPAAAVADASWISKPKSEWPQIVLTNEADFIGHSPLQGASCFLIQAADHKTLAATAAHLVGEAGGVEPGIPVGQLDAKIRSWAMFPRTMPDRRVMATGLGAPGLGRKNLDWLLLKIESRGTLPAEPLRVRKEPVQVGERVYLVGCPYAEEDCRQNVYAGTVTARAYGDRFRYDIDPPVDIRGFSGAPILDLKGRVVGVMTIWFDPKMSGEKFLEAGGEDAAAIDQLIQPANDAATSKAK